jgi:hypothetical protein
VGERLLAPSDDEGNQEQLQLVDQPALMACPAGSAPPTVRSCPVADFSCRTTPGSKVGSSRVLALDTDASVNGGGQVERLLVDVHAASSCRVIRVTELGRPTAEFTLAARPGLLV